MSRPDRIAQLERVMDMPGFPKSAGMRLVAAEPGTVAWFAVRFDRSTFAIFDAFNDEVGREAHLSGQVAAALMAHADELLAATPQIRKSEVLADKLRTPS